MNNPNTLTISLPGIEAKLDRIIKLLETMPRCADCAKDVAEAAVASTAAALRQATQDGTEAAPVTEDTPAAPAPAPDPDPAPWEPDPSPFPDQPAIKHSDVQKKVVELSAAGKKDAVKAVVTAYAKNVSGIPEDKLAEVWARLTELEG